VLLLTSGAAGVASSVNVAPASSAAQNATGLLRLGTLQGGIETLGGAVTRPRANANTNTNDPTQAAYYYLVGDNALPTTGVASVHAGSDGMRSRTTSLFIDALQRLNNRDDVSLIAAPGRGSPTMVGAAMNYCANRSLSDCFFVGDLSQDDDTIDEAQTFMAAITPKNSYGAIYLPWLQVPDPTGASAEPVPYPLRVFIAGLLRQDRRQRGRMEGARWGPRRVSPAPTGSRWTFTDVEQGNLNPRNINVIRQFRRFGHVVIWGARTVTADASGLMSRCGGLRSCCASVSTLAFNGQCSSPNDTPLWNNLRLNITAFHDDLVPTRRVSGGDALASVFVKCDYRRLRRRTTSTSGSVNVLVGFAPLKPAEFIVIENQPRRRPGVLNQIDIERGEVHAEVFGEHDISAIRTATSKFKIMWDNTYVAGLSKCSALKRSTEVGRLARGCDPFPYKLPARPNSSRSRSRPA